MLSQTIEVQWTKPDSPEHTRLELLCAPTVIQSTSGSCIFSACNHVSVGLSLERLCEIGQKTKVFVLSELPDNAKSNYRKKCAWAEALPNNCMYLRDLGCCAHRVHRVIAAATREEKIVGDIHAVSFIASQPRYRSTMSQKLREVVASDFEVVAAADPAWKPHMSLVLNHTLGREFHYVKARGLNACASDHNLSQAALARISDLAIFVNGDIKSNKIVHVCTGCCRNREESIENVSAVIEAAIFSQLGGEQPSNNRWGSCSRHLGIQVE